MFECFQLALDPKSAFRVEAQKNAVGKKGRQRKKNEKKSAAEEFDDKEEIERLEKILRTKDRYTIPLN